MRRSGKRRGRWSAVIQVAFLGVSALGLARAWGCVGTPASTARVGSPASTARVGTPASTARVGSPASTARLWPAASAVARHVFLGTPVGPSAEPVLDRGAYVLAYDSRRNVARWVAWQVAQSDLGDAPRSRGFRSDLLLPPAVYRVSDADYQGSGWDRGHLCPSADRTSSPADNAATFLLSNVHPQHHELNTGPWEQLEQDTRRLVREGRAAWVVAGGLFEDERVMIARDGLPSHAVAVPTASWKVVVAVAHEALSAQDPSELAQLAPESIETMAVVMPNQAGLRRLSWSSFAMSIDEVERRTGYDFFDRLPEPLQSSLEARRSTPTSAQKGGDSRGVRAAAPPKAGRKVTSATGPSDVQIP